MGISTVVTNNLAYIIFSFILFSIGSIYFFITNDNIKKLINSLKFKIPFIKKLIS